MTKPKGNRDDSKNLPKQDGNKQKSALSPLETLSALTIRHEAILSAVPEIIMEVNNDKVYSWANQAGLDFFGEDVLGKEAAFYFEGEQKTYDRVQPLFDGEEKIIYLESWQRRKDGAKRLLAWWCRVLKDEQGRVTGALSSARDITEERQQEETLRESEEKFRNFFEYSIVGKSMTGIDGTLKINNAFCQLVGYTKDELSKLKWRDITHPEDRERDQQIINSLISGEKASARWEKRYIHKNGNIVWVLLSTSLQRDKDGKPLYFISAVLDITERKQAEKDIEMLSHAIQSVNECISITDQENNFLYVNEAFVKTYGYERKELIGNKTSILGLGETPEKMAEILKATFQGGWQGELINTKKDGTKFPIFLSTSVIRDDHHQPIALIGVARDITARQQAEEALRNKMEELERFQKLTVGRELTMIELKKEVNELLIKSGQKEKYRIVE